MNTTPMKRLRGRWLIVLSLALAAGGCSYSLPFLAQPGAPAAQGATAAKPAREKATQARASHSKPAKAEHAKPAHANSKHGRHAQEAEPGVATPRDPIEEARTRAMASPAEPYWPYHAAELYLTRSAPDSALDALRGALARDGGYAPALALFSKLEYDAGRHDDAIAVLESARLSAQHASRDLAPELLAGLALHYAAAGRTADADQALRSVPPSGHKAIDATAVAVALGGVATAATEATVERAEAAAHAEPNSAACRNNAGIARLRAGDVAGARKALLEAIELDAHRPGPYYNLAILEKYYALDDAAARRWFAKYRALSSDDPDGLGAALEPQEPKDLAEGSKP